MHSHSNSPHARVYAGRDKLAVVGAGGHGKVVAAAALAAGCWREIVFLDDGMAAGSTVIGLPVVGGVGMVQEGIRPQDYDIAVAVGDNGRRAQLAGRLKELGFVMPDIVHPNAVLAPYVSLGGGCVVCAGAVVQPGSVLGEGCIVNTAATVDHDCMLGAFVHISPGAHLAGGTHIGAQSWIGIGAVTRQQTRIGSGVVVGAGAVVVKDIADGITAVGNPARPIREKRPSEHGSDGSQEK